MFPDFVENSIMYSHSTIFMDICTVLAVQGGQSKEYGPFSTPNLAILQHMPQNGGPCFRKNRDPNQDSLVFYILIKAFYLKLPQELGYLSNLTYIFAYVSKAVATFA